MRRRVKDTAQGFICKKMRKVTICQEPRDPRHNNKTNLLGPVGRSASVVARTTSASPP
jgi:hypothetical protein